MFNWSLVSFTQEMAWTICWLYLAFTTVTKSWKESTTAEELGVLGHRSKFLRQWWAEVKSFYDWAQDRIQCRILESGIIENETELMYQCFVDTDTDQVDFWSWSRISGYAIDILVWDERIYSHNFFLWWSVAYDPVVPQLHLCKKRCYAC